MIARGAGLALLVPLASALRSDAIPLTLRLLPVALWIIAMARPHAALVALTLLAPIGSWLAAFAGAVPLRCTEALVLAALSGTLVAFPRPPKNTLGPQRPTLVPPAIIFCALAAAAAAVPLNVTRAPWPFLRGFAMHVWRDYLVAPPGVPVGVSDAATLVEGPVLMIVVARHARDAVTRPAQLLAATALGGALAALVALTTFARTASHASSFSMMTAFVAGALAVNRRQTRVPRYPRMRRMLWIGAAALIIASTWIGGSRVAQVATADDSLQRMGGALGLAGLVAFVWLLGAMAMRLARGLRADPGDRLLIGSTAALATFVAIWMTESPLLPAEAAFPFWMLAGAALARADGDAQPPHAAFRGSIE